LHIPKADAHECIAYDELEAQRRRAPPIAGIGHSNLDAA
jgi:hypothetical protein